MLRLHHFKSWFPTAWGFISIITLIHTKKREILVSIILLFGFMGFWLLTWFEVTYLINPIQKIAWFFRISLAFTGNLARFLVELKTKKISLYESHNTRKTYLFIKISFDLKKKSVTHSWGHTTSKSIVWETVFLNQLYDFSLLALY